MDFIRSSGEICAASFFEEKDIYFVVYPPLEDRHPLQEIIDILYSLSVEAGLHFVQVRFIEERFLEEFKAVQGYDIQSVLLGEPP